MISFAQDPWDTSSPTSIQKHAQPSVCGTTPTNEVREVPTNTPHWSQEIAELRGIEAARALERMADEDLQQWIDHCGRQMLAAHKLLEGGEVDYFALSGERTRWRMQMEAALRERHRRPHIVAEMERRAGLA